MYKRTFIVLVVVSQSHVFYLADQTQVWMSTAEAAGLTHENDDRALPGDREQLTTRHSS